VKQIIGSAPYFVVQDLGKSLDFYCDTLGFERPRLWGDPPEFAMPNRDGFIFMLKQAQSEAAVAPNRNHGGYWDAYVWVVDTDALFAEFKAEGARFDYELCIQEEYGNKEFAVLDPDGYSIAFGQNLES
jgi:catechol 2,3-dioxygenase-like lactoylglutathione lyase family enzyme